MKLVMAFGHVVLSDEEERFIVRGPDDVIHALEFLRQQFASAKIFYLQSELPVDGGIGRISQQMIVIARNRDAHAEKLMAFREGILIEDDFLGRAQTAALAAMNRVILSFFGATVIKKLA